MAKDSSFNVLVESFEQLMYYMKYEFPNEAYYVVTQYILPFFLLILVAQGLLASITTLFRWIIPPNAKELHRYVFVKKKPICCSFFCL